MPVVVNFCRLSKVFLIAHNSYVIWLLQSSEWRFKNLAFYTKSEDNTCQVMVFNNKSLWGQCLQDFWLQDRMIQTGPFVLFSCEQCPFVQWIYCYIIVSTPLKKFTDLGSSRQEFSVTTYKLAFGLNWKWRRSYTKEIMVSQVLSKSELGRYINLSRVISDHRPEGSL